MPLADGEGITTEELQLAARNHGMPLEALRHDVTPVGLHYLLIHYDIPYVDPATYRLTIGDRQLSLDEIRALPSVTRPVTMECAGNGRAALAPRPISQPWLLEAVGNAEWTGTPLEAAPRRRRRASRSSSPGSTAASRTRWRRPTSDRCRSTDATADDVLLAYDLNGAPLPPQHGFPLRLLVPGWYGMTSVKWLTRITVLDEPFDGYQNATAYRVRRHEDEPGTPVSRIEPRALFVPPGVPDFMTRHRFLEAGPDDADGPRLVGPRPDRLGRGRHRRRVARGRARGGARLARVQLRVGRAAGRARPALPRDRHDRPRAA